jgi:hypothetical protein
MNQQDNIDDVTEKIMEFLKQRKQEHIEKLNDLEERDETLALEFLKINNPFSYRCASSDITAEDIIQNSYALAILPEIGSTKLIAGTVIFRLYGSLPAGFYKRFKEYELICDKVSTTFINLDSHMGECLGCKLFDELYSGYKTAKSKYRGEIKELFEKPFGYQAWAWTLALVRQNGYSTFEDYLAKTN